MISKFLQILGLQPRSFSRSLEQFLLTVGQNNLSNKIPFILFYFFSVFDLKAVRKAVDFGFDTFMPTGDSEIYNIMGPQSRNDIYSIEIDDIDNPQMAAQVKKLKEESNLRKSITTALGGLMAKQECRKQALCFIGVSFRTLPGILNTGKDLALM